MRQNLTQPERETLLQAGVKPPPIRMSAVKSEGMKQFEAAVIQGLGLAVGFAAFFACVAGALFAVTLIVGGR